MLIASTVASAAMGSTIETTRIMRSIEAERGGKPALDCGFKNRGFHGGTIASFAATVATARLMGLSAIQTMHAISLSATSGGGLMAASNTGVRAITMQGTPSSMASRRRMPQPAAAILGIDWSDVEAKYRSLVPHAKLGCQRGSQSARDPWLPRSAQGFAADQPASLSATRSAPCRRPMRFGCVHRIDTFAFTSAPCVLDNDTRASNLRCAFRLAADIHRAYVLHEIVLRG